MRRHEEEAEAACVADARMGVDGADEGRAAPGAAAAAALGALVTAG